MTITGIDPGDRQSAIVTIDGRGEVLRHAILPNKDMMTEITAGMSGVIAIEMIASYGMPVGKTVFETCVFVGRMVQALGVMMYETRVIYRKDVKMHLCNSMRAKDGNIRQALIDRYPATGGGKNPVIGTKKEPGALYGISKDEWAALGVAITAQAKWDELEQFDNWL